MATRRKVPKIAFTNGITWSVIYDGELESGVWEIHKMPSVDCPIVDTSDADEKKMDKILRKVSRPDHFRLDGTIEKMKSAGCKITCGAGKEVV